jgi:hypothetical protein
MRPGCKLAPATYWWAFFLFATTGASIFGGQPAAKPPELAQFGKPDAAEAARLVEEVRQAGLPGQYFLEFELHTLLRRGGDGKVFKGALWGARNQQGPVMRVELTDAAGGIHRLLIQSGEKASVTRWRDGRVESVEGAQLMAPIISGIEISAFDLQMPYLYWPNPFVEKITRSNFGRPSNAFMFPPPASFTAHHPEIGGVRANLDTKFNALIQAEVLGRDTKLVKSFALLSVKHVGDQVVPKQVDYRNEVTRDKTRLQITAAALGLTLPPSTFDAANLAQNAARPSASQVVRFEP